MLVQSKLNRHHAIPCFGSELFAHVKARMKQELNTTGNDNIGINLEHPIKVEQERVHSIDKSY